MTGLADSTSGRMALSQEAEGWWTYGAPFVLFGLLTMVEGYTPVRWYPVVYFVKMAAVTISLVLAGAARREISPSTRGLALSALLGLAVFAGWVAIDTWVPYPHLGHRVAFDPFTALRQPSWAAPAFLCVRFYGLVLLVPVMEELFMRSFLLRYFTNSDFERVPIGSFSLTAFWIVAGLSALSHPEWLVAIIASCAYALLLRRTRSLFQAVAAHAMTNAALGLYVVLSGDWKYW
jgi:CAAX protease family protein